MSARSQQVESQSMAVKYPHSNPAGTSNIHNLFMGVIQKQLNAMSNIQGIDTFEWTFMLVQNMKQQQKGSEQFRFCERFGICLKLSEDGHGDKEATVYHLA